MNLTVTNNEKNMKNFEAEDYKNNVNVQPWGLYIFILVELHFKNPSITIKKLRF